MLHAPQPEGSGDPRSLSEVPLERWLLAIAKRCAKYRCIGLGDAACATLSGDAVEVVLGLFQARLPDLIVGVPSAAAGAGHLVVKLGVDWAVYRHIARTADDSLSGRPHTNRPSSKHGSPRIAEEGAATPFHERGNSRFTDAYPVAGIAPYTGWTLCEIFPQENNDRVREHIARGPDRDVHVPVSRFRIAFTPTQARFDYLASIGFTEKPGRDVTGPWDDQCIDRAIAATGRAVAA